MYVFLLAEAVVLFMTACGSKGKDGQEAGSQADVTWETSVEQATEAAAEEAVAETAAEKETAETAAEKETAEAATEETSAADQSADAGSDEEAFYISEITDEIFERIKGKSFKNDCTLPREDLRYLHVLHKDINGQVHEGEMIVNRHIAEDVLDILHELYDKDYPIEKIRLIDEYGADDEMSMEDNNSSSFNFRYISHTNRISKHGLALAVDINPLYNPYTKEVDGERIVEPLTGEPYLDRDASFDYKIEKGDLCYKLFIDHGFEWGGEWTSCKDYQHFEIAKEKAAEWYPAK